MLRRLAPWIILPVVALLAISPVLRHGVSCGHDLGFHTMSWLDAADQLRHGTLYPRWATTPAWHAGEPRFVFYPPLSWMSGALLTMVLQPDTATMMFLWLVLSAAGLAMYRLVHEFVDARLAITAAALYIVNPYMLFNAFERSALAELLASVWMPLLLLGLLRPRPTWRSIAVPLALLWLTNAPAGVMGSYLLALIAVIRVLQQWSESRRAGAAVKGTVRFTLMWVGGALGGLALPAFYLLPAAWERRYVQVSMAILPGMRFQDNFLFAHTGDAAHDAVNRTASLIALSLLAAVVVFLTVHLLPRGRGVIGVPPTAALAAPLVAAVIVITLLLVPLSTPLWKLLPNLAYLQFPWRLLTILAVVAALLLALVLDRLDLDANRLLVAVPLFVVALASFEYTQTVQVCESGDGPNWLQGVVASGHGVPPTDEYTPNDADNDVLRTDSPGYWIVPSARTANDANAPAPGTLPNPTQLNPDFQGNVPLSQTISSEVPHQLSVTVSTPAVLILNLRSYPRWDIRETDDSSHESGIAKQVPRDDGLLAIPLAHAGHYTFQIAWRHGRDEWFGGAVSLIALLTLILTPFAKRRSATVVA